MKTLKCYIKTHMTLSVPYGFDLVRNFGFPPKFVVNAFNKPHETNLPKLILVIPE